MPLVLISLKKKMNNTTSAGRLQVKPRSLNWATSNPEIKITILILSKLRN